MLLYDSSQIFRALNRSISSFRLHVHMIVSTDSVGTNISGTHLKPYRVFLYSWITQRLHIKISMNTRVKLWTLFTQGMIHLPTNSSNQTAYISSSVYAETHINCMTVIKILADNNKQRVELILDRCFAQQQKKHNKTISTLI